MLEIENIILIVFTHRPTSDPKMELTHACIHTKKCVVLLYNALYLFESQTKGHLQYPEGSVYRTKLAFWASLTFLLPDRWAASRLRRFCNLQPQPLLRPVTPLDFTTCDLEKSMTASRLGEGHTVE